MNVLQEYSMEYGFKTSPRLLFTAISTPEGLSRWFADQVIPEGELFRFVWEDSEQLARIQAFKDNEYIRFQWVEDNLSDLSFELRILHDPVSSGIALMITDQAESHELELSKRVWDAQVKRLQRLFSS